MQVTPMVVKILSDESVNAQKAFAYAEDYVRRFGGDVSVTVATPEDASALLGGLKVRLPRLFWGDPPAEGEKWPKYRNGGPGAFLSAFPIPKGARGKGAPNPASKSQEKRIVAQSEPAPATTSKPKAPTVAELMERTDVLLEKIEAQDKSMADLARRIGITVGEVQAKVDLAIEAMSNVNRVDGDSEAPKHQEATSPDGSVRQFVEERVATSTSQVHAHLDDMHAAGDKRNEEIIGLLREIQGSL